MSERAWPGRELHFIGIGGAGMSGLALIADQLGAAVSGSDRAPSTYSERLAAAGIQAAIGHDPDVVPPDAEIIVSSAIGDDNPELAAARSRGQRVLHRGALLAEICALRRLIAVAGTHGKTTTAGMIVHAWRAAGEDLGFAIGGELPGSGKAGAVNAAWGGSEWFVAEADESDASFLELSPEVAVVTNVELDHHARWSSRAELIAAFETFASPARAVVIAEDPALRQVGATAAERRKFPAAGDDAIARTLTVPGRHNAANATAALAAVELAGGPVAAAREAIATFPGIVRRMEAKGLTASGARVYDDYAHHPTEVSAVLAAARELGARRLIAVFQPHLYSRTKELSGAFGRALAAADVVGVLDVYPAREQPVGELAGVSGLDVARAAADAGQGRPVWWLPTIDDAVARLRTALLADDLVVTIGAGDVFRVGESLLDPAGERP
jgi:UDP-N-acetylmuramate--alanine ligase